MLESWAKILQSTITSVFLLLRDKCRHEYMGSKMRKHLWVYFIVQLSFQGINQSTSKRGWSAKWRTTDDGSSHLTVYRILNQLDDRAITITAIDREVWVSLLKHFARITDKPS